MYKFATGVFTNLDDLLTELKKNNTDKLTNNCPMCTYTEPGTLIPMDKFGYCAVCGRDLL